MTGLEGVDVSSFQGSPRNWQPNAGKIGWAGVKVSELSAAGPYVNPAAPADWAALHAMGAGRVGYLFAHPGMSVADTAALFEVTIRGLGLADDDMVCVDLEIADGRTAAQVATWAVDLCSTLHRDLGRKPLLYTYLSFAETGHCAGLGGYPLWISDPSSPAGRPRIPMPWREWTIHQYGITGAIDRDVAKYDTRAAMTKALGKPAKPKPATSPRQGEDNTMFTELTAGQRAVFPIWVAAPKGGKAPYDHASLTVAGDAGAVVTVTFYPVNDADKPQVKKHVCKSGIADTLTPDAGWDKVQAVAVARADTASAAVASAVVTRW